MFARCRTLKLMKWNTPIHFLTSIYGIRTSEYTITIHHYAQIGRIIWSYTKIISSALFLAEMQQMVTMGGWWINLYSAPEMIKISGKFNVNVLCLVRTFHQGECKQKIGLLIGTLNRNWLYNRSCYVKAHPHCKLPCQINGAT